MARHTIGLLPDDQVLHLTLDRYQEIMRLCPSAFNGLYRSGTDECCDCDAIWKQSDRDGLAMALAQAEEMRERELGYHLAPAYDEDELHKFANPVILDKKHVIEIGSRVCDDIEDSVALTLSVGGVINDPVVITVATTVTDPSEIHVYYPGEDVEIRPQSVAISAGFATISIIRARLITWEAANSNCDPAPNYDDDANFITTVDVKRCYTDPSDGMFFVWIGDCGNCCDTDFAEATQQLYPIIDNSRVGIVSWRLGTYAAGVWTAVCEYDKCCRPYDIRVSYKSGIRSSIATELETAHLAHTLLPDLIPDRINLCSGCWKEDLAASKEMNPYGWRIGTSSAWRRDSRAKVGYGGKIPRSR